MVKQKKDLFQCSKYKSRWNYFKFCPGIENLACNEKKWPERCWMVPWCSWYCITLTQARIRKNVENTWSNLCFLLSLFIYSQLKQKLFQPLMPSFTIAHGTYHGPGLCILPFVWAVLHWWHMEMLFPGSSSWALEDAGGRLACALVLGRRLEGGWHVPWSLGGGWREAGQPAPFRPADPWGV